MKRTMAGRGWFSAITAVDVERLLALPEPARWHFAEADDGIVKAAFELHMDKAWVPIHRAISDGTLFGTLGERPLSSAILGDHLICQAELDDFIYLKHPMEVAEIAAALANLTREGFAEKPDAIPEEDEDAAAFCLDLVPQDIEYAWPYFEEMREFYQRAAAGGFAVLFSWG
ncbi:MAG TPA: DUF1877 family protein [Tepidisphaeraceae bacterium]|jgi:hypothetical protein|nr:DUF1877 family protein [Tepidisphaeraceae bacterium]